MLIGTEFRRRGRGQTYTVVQSLKTGSKPRSLCPVTSK